MDKKTLDKLKRLREILFAMGITYYPIVPTYRQQKTHKKILESLSQTLYFECIQRYDIRKKMHKEIRDMLKEEAT